LNLNKPNYAGLKALVLKLQHYTTQPVKKQKNGDEKYIALIQKHAINSLSCNVSFEK
jgi:hypothetical protein